LFYSYTPSTYTEIINTYKFHFKFGAPFLRIGQRHEIAVYLIKLNLN